MTGADVRPCSAVGPLPVPPAPSRAGGGVAAAVQRAQGARRRARVPGRGQMRIGRGLPAHRGGTDRPDRTRGGTEDTLVPPPPHRGGRYVQQPPYPGRGRASKSRTGGGRSGMSTSTPPARTRRPTHATTTNPSAPSASASAPSGWECCGSGTGGPATPASRPGPTLGRSACHSWARSPSPCWRRPRHGSPTASGAAIRVAGPAALVILAAGSVTALILSRRMHGDDTIVLTPSVPAEEHVFPGRIVGEVPYATNAFLVAGPTSLWSSPDHTGAAFRRRIPAPLTALGTRPPYWTDPDQWCWSARTGASGCSWSRTGRTCLGCWECSNAIPGASGTTPPTRLLTPSHRPAPGGGNAEGAPPAWRRPF